MISFKPMGRLGNFLFSFAATIAYAKKHGIEYSAPTLTNDNFWNPVYLPHLVNPKFDQGRADVIVNEKVLYKFDEIPFKEEWRDKQIVLRGYFQNPAYFENYRKEIIEAFGLSRYDFNKGTVSVHVRRGDYLTLLEKHPSVTKGWYENAMKQFPDHEFLFFSDDIEWCQREFGGRRDCEFVVRERGIDGLKLMTGCEHHINSASTFSWMGAWLNTNKDKKVIVPKQWLMPQSSNQWTEEIVPKGWIRI